MIYTYAKIQNTDNLTTISNSNRALMNYLPETVAKLDGSAKDITDRQTINITDTYIRNFKAYTEFKSTNKMLDYFLEEITKIYQECDIAKVEDKIKKFVSYTKKFKFKFYNYNRIFYDAKDLYNFLRKVTLFIAISFKTPYNQIANIVSCLFYRCSATCGVQKPIVNFLRSIEIQDIHEVATNKNLYLCISSKKFKYNLSHENIKNFTYKRHEDNSNRINTINQIVDSCNNNLRKKIISKYINNILQICADKCIATNYTFVELVKKLLTFSEITCNEIELILRKILIYLQLIDDQNAYENIDMITNLFCNARYVVDIKKLLAFCLVTDEHIKYMASQKNSTIMKNNNILEEFSTSSASNVKEEYLNASKDETTKNETAKNETTTSQKSVQEISIATKFGYSIVLPNTGEIKEDTILKIVDKKSKVMFLDPDDCKRISEFCIAEKKLFAEDKVHNTNATNNTEAKKRQADEQTYNQAKKIKLLDGKQSQSDYKK